MNESMRFKYVFEEDYNPKYANGAYGGVSPTGEIVVNFYLERLPVPKEDTYTRESDGRIGEFTKRIPQDINDLVIRYIQNGVILSLDHAKAIHTWLGEKIKEAEQLEQLKHSLQE